MDTRYSNPGKILRELLPDQGLPQGTILVWTVVYLLNLAAVLLVQYHLIYTLLRPDGKHIDTDGLLGTSYVVVTGSSITDTGGYSLNFDSAELMAPLLWALLPFSLEVLIHSILRRALSG